MRNLALGEDLTSRVEELRRSRRRIVTVQDETRRKLERDLHDGAQQRLVALKIKAALTRAMAAKAGLADVEGILDEVVAETDRTIEAVRDFARGIYPPLLEAEGLATALRALLGRWGVNVEVLDKGLDRYGKETESTIYFCVAEVVKLVPDSSVSGITVELEAVDGMLVFTVVSVDSDSTAPVDQLINVVDRIEALGGALEVAPNGWKVVGSVPARSMETV
jgi:signal transduction histidine kinase